MSLKISSRPLFGPKNLFFNDSIIVFFFFSKNYKILNFEFFLIHSREIFLRESDLNCNFWLIDIGAIAS